MGDGTALFFGACGFEVLEVVEADGELVVEVQTTARVVGCSACGGRARAKDRRWVTLRDAPSAGRPVRVRWRKRIWTCPDGDCSAVTWTEQAALAGPRRVLTERAATWAADRVAAREGTPASLARDLGVSWAAVWDAVERIGRPRVTGPGRVGATAMVGFDETVMAPAHRRRRRRFVTAVVDVGSGQILSSRAATPQISGPGWPPCPRRGWPGIEVVSELVRSAASASQTRPALEASPSPPPVTVRGRISLVPLFTEALPFPGLDVCWRFGVAGGVGG